MSTTTVHDLGANLRGWLAAVQTGDTVAVMDNGQEIARIVPGIGARQPHARGVKLNAWSQQRLAELAAVFPEPVTGASAELEFDRAGRL